jgi:NADH:ubiquinone oxidoreductase subunit E/NAD-dependent dihydropyrimidine dehydrogenase PreA subunit
MNTITKPKSVGAALVVGGGIGGMQAALDLAESGIKVYMAESRPSIGGVMSQLDKTFPTNDCAMCTIAPRLVSIGRHKDIDVLTLSDVKKFEGGPGHFHVTLNRRARFVDEHVCTGCGTCVGSCPVRFVPQPLDGEPAVELAPDVQARVDQIIGEHRYRQGPLMPILQSVNAVYNFFSENVLRYIARELRLPLAQVLRVATFYNAFSIVPRGKYIINVCMGTTCYVRGSQRLMDRFSDLLKIKPEETTPDMHFTLKCVRCIGCCGLAPAAMVGESVYGKLTIRDVPNIIEQHQRIHEHAKVDAG